jgi:replicative DNA helicase
LNALTEEKILAFAASSRDNCDRVIHSGVSPDWFRTEANSQLADILFSSCIRYRSLPGVDQLINELDKRFPDNESTRSAVLEAFNKATSRARIDHVDDIDYWIEELRRYRAALKTKIAINNALDRIDSNEPGSLEVALQTLMTDIQDIAFFASRAEETTMSVNDPAFMQKRLESYAELKSNPDKYGGIKTGLTEFDDAVGGIRPGELFVFVARHGVGKSAMLNTIAHNAFVAGKNVMFAGIEMSQQMNAMRFDARYALISLKRLRNGCLTEDEEERYQECLELMQYFPNKLFFVPRSRCRTIQDIQKELTICEKIHEVKIDLLVIDYLNILHSYTIDKNPRLAVHEQQRILAQECRWVAAEHNVGVVTASQSNRQGIDKNLSARTEILALSDFIGATADVVVRLIRGEEERQSNTIVADIIKNRNGENRKIVLACDLDKMLIEDLSIAPMPTREE